MAAQTYVGMFASGILQQYGRLRGAAHSRPVPGSFDDGGVGGHGHRSRVATTPARCVTGLKGTIGAGKYNVNEDKMQWPGIGGRLGRIRQGG